MSKRKPLLDEAPRSGRARPAGELAAEVGGMTFRRFGFVQASVVSRWGEIVGERYARVSVPESIRFPAGKKSAGVLTLLVEGAHAPLMQHLTPLIIERVNRFFGYPAVNKVAFRQGRPPPEVPRPKRPEFRPVPREIGQGLREIADPELRACLESLAVSLASTTGPPKIGDADNPEFPATIRSE